MCDNCGYDWCDGSPMPLCCAFEGCGWETPVADDDWDVWQDHTKAHITALYGDVTPQRMAFEMDAARFTTASLADRPL